MMSLLHSFINLGSWEYGCHPENGRNVTLGFPLPYLATSNWNHKVDINKVLPSLIQGALALTMFQLPVSVDNSKTA